MIIIVGAGIGGLMTAVALLKNGFEDVCILEQTPRFGAIGAGVQISSNASRVLRHYGLEGGLQQYGCRSDGVWYHDILTGEELYRCNAGPWGERQYGAPLYHLHRADLHKVLCDAIPPSWIKCAAKVAAVRSDGQDSAVLLADGSELKADLIIGADGLRSTVRDYVVAPAAPHYSGFIARRALIPAERVKDLKLEQACYVWSGQGKILTVYWCAAGRLLNMLAGMPATDPRAESWSATDGTVELRRGFAEATEIVQNLVSCVDSPLVTGIFDRPVPERFFRDLVVLLGDAAHPVVPYLANGAAQAIEDAHVLARVLSRRKGDRSPHDALAEYEARRRQRVDNVQQASADIMRSQHVRDEDQRIRRNERLKQARINDPNGLEMRGWLWGYDVLLDTEKEITAATSKDKFENSLWISQSRN